MMKGGTSILALGLTVPLWVGCTNIDAGDGGGGFGITDTNNTGTGAGTDATGGGTTDDSTDGTTDGSTDGSGSTTGGGGSDSGDSVMWDVRDTGTNTGPQMCACADKSDRIFVTSDDRELWLYDPEDNDSFTKRGDLDCPNTGNSYSMAMGRDEIAWVRFRPNGDVALR